MFNLVSKLFSDGLIYLLISFYFFLLVILENVSTFSKYRYVFATISFIILILFTGLRWETGTDWDSYKDLFDSIEFNWSFLLNVYSFDIGYVFFNALLKLTTNNYSIFILIDSALALLLLMNFINKYSPNPNLSIFVFYNAFFVAQFMGSNRRIIALVFSLYTFSAIFEKKKKLTFVNSTLSFSFHRSSLATLIALYIPKIRFTLGKTVAIILFGLILGIPQLPAIIVGNIGKFFLTLINNPIFEKTAFYADNIATSENVDPVAMTILSTVKRSIFLIFYFIIIFKKNGKLDLLTDFFFNIYIFGFFLYVALNGSTIYQMLSTYFTFIELVLIGRMWSYAKGDLKIIFLIFLFFYGFIQLLSSLNAYPELYMPYKSYFNK